MDDAVHAQPVAHRFRERFGGRPAVIASAPGRLEVLGNHTDYNGGMTLSCAVAFRCYAAVAASNDDLIRLASTAFDADIASFPIHAPAAPQGHWANYVLGLVTALQSRGHDVPGFEMLVDSAVPRSAGVSSSAALEMAALAGLMQLMGLSLPPIERARIGQQAELSAVGARTGLLDQLSSLLGETDHLLATDFASLQTQTIAVPTGWCFVAVDSGVTHDLTAEYNDRRSACEAAVNAMGVALLSEADASLLQANRDAMPGDVYRCAAHVLGENQRVKEAVAALEQGDIESLGSLMFASHASSRDNFRNSHASLDELVEFAEADGRCIGARLSGGGFGGITIHLVRQKDAQGYRDDITHALQSLGRGDRWSAVCKIDGGATIHSL